MKNHQNCLKKKKKDIPNDLRSWVNSSKINLKKSPLRHIIVKLQKTKDKEKILIITRERDNTYIQKNNSKGSRFFFRNHGGQKNTLQHFLRDERKDSINPEYYIHQNCKNKAEIKTSSDELN